MSEPALPPLPPLRDVVARHGLDARKSLGQHFLMDGNLTARIARSAGDLAGRHVIEVGPGPGGLTRALLASEATDVTVVEIDPRAVAVMHELREVFPERLVVREADAVRLDLAALVPQPRQVIANLPYNVATPLLVACLRQAAAFERLTLMFQLEVAERICAAPDTPAYGRLSVLAQWVCETSLLLRIPPTAFTPPPKVWSAVVGLVPRAVQPGPALFAAMERLTAAAFGQRRKMLRGSLRGIGGAALLARAEIAPERRAETLSVAEFDLLARILAEDPGVMPGIVVIGAGGHAKVVIELLRAAGQEIAGLIDPAPPGPFVLGVPVLGDDAVLPRLGETGLSTAVIALGGNALRERIGARLAALGFALPAVIHPTAQVSPSARIGDGAVIMAGAMIGPDAEIGALAIVNTRAVVEHDNRIGVAAHVAPGAVLAGNVTVGDRALVGAGSAVRPGIAIGADAVVGVGSAVVADVPAGATVAGTPARPLRPAGRG